MLLSQTISGTKCKAHMDSLYNLHECIAASSIYPFISLKAAMSFFRSNCRSRQRSTVWSVNLNDFWQFRTFWLTPKIVGPLSNFSLFSCDFDDFDFTTVIMRPLSSCECFSGGRRSWITKPITRNKWMHWETRQERCSPNFLTTPVFFFYLIVAGWQWSRCNLEQLEATDQRQRRR